MHGRARLRALFNASTHNNSPSPSPSPSPRYHHLYLSLYHYHYYYQHQSCSNSLICHNALNASLYTRRYLSTSTKSSTNRSASFYDAHDVSSGYRILLTQESSWSCNAAAPIGSFFCEHCNVVLPPCGRCNYFQFFKIPVTFRIDPAQLQSKFRDLQRTLHPDKFHQRSAREQRFSRDQSASLNTAYTVLNDPLLRAQYLLTLRGEDVLAEGKQLLDTKQLQDFLEAREEVEDASSVSELSSLRAESEVKNAELVSSLTKDFDLDNLEDAKRHTIELQYLTKLREELANKIALLSE